MSKKLNLSSKLDFSEMDLTAPDKVIEEILLQLPEETQNMIWGTITPYDGPVTSYTTRTKSLAEVLGTINSETHVDIQDALGKHGEEDKKFECYLYTPRYTKYRYRMFFIKYGIANYPVQFTLEESIAQSIFNDQSKCILACNNRKDVEDLLFSILTSKKVVGVMQELIRVFQAQKDEETTKVIDASNDNE